jgi:RHS repeat-associated protein
LLIATVSGTTKSYFHQDHLGGTRLVTQSGSVVFSTNYEPFGVPYGASGSDPSVKYTGQWSEALGLYWNHARYYDPTIGRFVSADPVLGHMSAPQTLDRYAYAVNNPMRFADPSGRDCSWNPLSWSDCVSAAGNAVGTGLSEASSAITSAAQGVSNWWNGLDPNIRTAIIFGLATIAIIATAGALAPALVPAMIEFAVIGGAISMTAYVGTTLASGGHPTIGGALSHFAFGAFLGAIGGAAGKVAEMAAANLPIGEAWAGTAETAIEYLILGGASAGASATRNLIYGKEIDPLDLARDAALAIVTASMGDTFFGAETARSELLSDTVGELLSPEILPLVTAAAPVVAYYGQELSRYLPLQDRG